MKLNKISFVFLFTSLVTAFNNYDVYQVMKPSDSWELIAHKAFKDQVLTKNSPQAICWHTNNEALPSIEAFSTAIKQYKKSEGMMKALKSLFKKEDLSLLKDAQMKAFFEITIYISNLYMMDISKNVYSEKPVSDDDEDLSGNIFGEILPKIDPKNFSEKPDPEKEKNWTNYSLLTRIRMTKKKDQSNKFDEEIESLDLAKAGTAFSKLVFMDDFLCMNVPDLSLFIFKLFYLEMFPRSRFREFMDAFLKNLLVIAKENNEKGEYVHHYLKEFFGYNLFVIMGINNSLADQLFDMLIRQDSQNYSDLFANFIQLYELTLDLVNQYQDKTDHKKQNFFKKLVKFDKSALKKLVGGATFLSLFYSVQILKGMGLGLTGMVAGVVLNEYADQLINPLVDKVKSYFPSQEYDDQVQCQSLISNVQSTHKGFEVKNLDRFLEYFEEAVQNYKGCHMCKINRTIRQNPIQKKQIVEHILRKVKIDPLNPLKLVI